MADETELDINIKGNASGVEGASKKAAAAVGAVTAESKQLDAAFRRLKSSIDPAFAATEKYNKALADNQRLLAAGRISQDEFAAGARAAKQALDDQLNSINANSAASKAAATAQREASRSAAAQERADALDAARAARQAAQEKRAAEVAAAREAAAAEREAKAEVRRVAREAAEAAKQAAREKRDAERQASLEAAAAEREAKAEQRRAVREAAEEAKRAAADKRQADRAAEEASRDLARSTRDAARAEREAANAVRELRASVDPAFAAQERYNETMRRATALLMQNRLAQGEFSAIQKQAAAQMDVNTRSMGRMNTVYVQMGYQAQDVTASLASGINPLVILAQQGGQTASALAMMGGTVGKVAAFFAGPWGAAIIGVTMLLGMYIQKNKESEKATKDATNAEDLRRMKLNDLTDALRDYNKGQREANLNTSAQREAKVQGAVNQINRATGEVVHLQKELAKAKRAQDALLQDTSGENGAALIIAANKVKDLENQIRKAQGAVATAQSSLNQARIGQLTASAGAAADEREAIRLRYEEEETRLQRNYALNVQGARGIADAKKRAAAISKADQVFEEGLTKAKKDQAAAEEKLSEEKKKARGADAAARREQREAYKEAKSDLQDQIEEYSYEQSVAGENYVAILAFQDKKIEAIKKFYGEESKEAYRAQRERVQIERRLWDQLIQEQEKGIEATTAAAIAAETAKNDVAKIGVDSKGDQTGFAQSTGAINNQSAIAQRAQQLQEAYQLEVNFENRLYALKLNALRNRLSLEHLPVGARNEINNQIAQLDAQHNQRLAVMAAQNSRNTVQIQNQAAIASSEKWRQAASTISQSLNSSFQGIWTKTMTWQQAMFNLADQLTYKLVAAGAKVLEDWIVQQAIKAGVVKASTAAETTTVVVGESAKTAATAAGTAARVGVTAAGTAATTSMTVGSALLSIGADAARAAAGAYAAIAGIPVVGPFLAPAAAGAALVAVMGLGAKIASAAGGQWQVPQDGQMTELHKDEMVLPAWAARPLRANLSAPSSAGMMGRAADAGASLRSAANDDGSFGSMRGGDTHNWTLQAMDAKSFQAFLENNPRALQAAMDKQLRQSLRRK